MGGGGGLLSPITNALFGSPPSAPAAPNYTAAAQQTAQGNLDAARQATAANRVNQVTPYGNLNYAITGSDPYGNPTWTATQTLSPDQQELYNMDIATSKGLGQLSNTGLDYVRNMMANPFSTASLPALQSSAGMPNMQQLTGQANLQTVGQGPSMYGVQGAQQAMGAGPAQQAYGISSGEEAQRMVNAPQLQTSLQDQGMAGWDRASNLMMQRLQPQMDIQQRTLDAKLANQGVVAGTEAYNRAKMGLGMQQNDLLNQAQLQAQGIGQNLFNQALQGGQFTNQALLGQNQAQLSNIGLNNQAIAQNFGQNLSAQQLQNQAAQQNYANLLAGTQLGNQAGQQNYANLLAGQGFNNQAAQQQYQNQLAAQAANNPALQQMYANQQQQQQSNNAIAQQQFANQMQNANLANQARQQGFGELSYMRNEPLNTLNAVRSGSQVQGANFVNPANQATTTGADYLSAAQAQGQYNMAGYNAQQAAQASANQGLMGLGGTLGAAAILSDIRTKENIKPIGWLPNGLPVYEYEYKPEFKAEAGYGKHIGVMAQEVEQVVPEAIITRADGYKMVDYAKL
jgi:hypothetical protein